MGLKSLYFIIYIAYFICVTLYIIACSTMPQIACNNVASYWTSHWTFPVLYCHCLALKNYDLYSLKAYWKSFMWYQFLFIITFLFPKCIIILINKFRFKICLGILVRIWPGVVGFNKLRKLFIYIALLHENNCKI